MSEVLSSPGVGASHDPKFVGPLGVFAPWRLQAYGYTLAAAYAGLLLYMYKSGVWLLDREGKALYQDFTNLWIAGVQALHGEAAWVYNPAAHVRAQEVLVGAGHAHYAIWPYPPTYFLIAVPLALLRYVAAFLTWEALTLLGLAVVIYLIVRRRPAIAVLLASPFTLWNIAAGQSGFLTASLLGASLLVLERRPVVAGVFIGCLTYKPQWGILIPVALVAAKEWRAVASATAMTVCWSSSRLPRSVSLLGKRSLASFWRRLGSTCRSIPTLRRSVSIPEPIGNISRRSLGCSASSMAAPGWPGSLRAQRRSGAR